MSTAAEYKRLLSQRDELQQHIGGLFEDPSSKQRNALVSYLSGELQRISCLCQDSLFSKISTISASVPADIATTLPGSPAASSSSPVSASVPVDDNASTASSKLTSAPASGLSAPPRKVLKFPRFIIESPKSEAFQAKVGSLFLYLMVSFSKCLSS